MTVFHVFVHGTTLVAWNEICKDPVLSPQVVLTGDVQQLILQSVFQESLDAWFLASGLVLASTSYLTYFGGCLKEDQLLARPTIS